MTYIKELTGGVSAGLAALIGTLQAGGHLTLLTWLIAASAALTGSGLVAGAGALTPKADAK